MELLFSRRVELVWNKGIAALCGRRFPGRSCRGVGSDCSFVKSAVGNGGES
jgi:hypothetical protein